jgi:outer membrane murein-binding lipoprotein Lpp
MEARIARLESDVGHLRTDVADIKVDVRSLRDKMDGMNTKLSERIDNLGASLNAKIDGVNNSLRADLNAKFDILTARDDSLKDSVARAKVWALVLYIALAATMLGTMARGFHWI